MPGKPLEQPPDLLGGPDAGGSKALTAPATATTAQSPQQLSQQAPRAASLLPRTNSGSSTYSSEACAGPVVLPSGAAGGWPAAMVPAHQHATVRGTRQQQQQQLCASGGSSSASEEQQQQQHQLSSSQQTSNSEAHLQAGSCSGGLTRALSGASLAPTSSAHAPDARGAPVSADASAAGTTADDDDAAAAAAASAEPSPAADGDDELRPNMPVAHLKVVCGHVSGVLMVHKARIAITGSSSGSGRAQAAQQQQQGKEKEVSPTEFERLGGRAATKKWKQSIRLIGEDGEWRQSSPSCVWHPAV